jgi:hypothetical protein
MATINLGKIKPLWRGDYSAGATYRPLDFVNYNNETYINILESTGNLPTNETYFEKVVQPDSIVHAPNSGLPNEAGTAYAYDVGQTGANVVPYANASGNVLIGTTTDNGIDKLQVNGSCNFNGASSLFTQRSIKDFKSVVNNADTVINLFKINATGSTGNNASNAIAQGFLRITMMAQNATGISLPYSSIVHFYARVRNTNIFTTAHEIVTELGEAISSYRADVTFDTSLEGQVIVQITPTYTGSSARILSCEIQLTQEYANGKLLTYTKL